MNVRLNAEPVEASAMSVAGTDDSTLRVVPPIQAPVLEDVLLAHTVGPLPPVTTTIAAVDICAFGDRRRNDDAQLALRTKMYGCLAQAFAITTLPWSECHREDRGDGALIVAPPDTPTDYFLDPLAHHLALVLRRANQLANDLGRLRLRLAVHAGPVHRDPHGVAGRSLVHLFRLLEATAFKKAMNQTDGDLAMIVSDRLYTDAVARGGFVDPAAYRKIRISNKETRTLAYLWNPPTPKK